MMDAKGQDKLLRCFDCGGTFVFTSGERLLSIQTAQYPETMQIVQGTASSYIGA